MKEQVEKILKEIRPSLEAHGGNIELVDVDEKAGIVKVRLQGACVGCPMSQMTLEHGVKQVLMKAVKGVNDVISTS